MRQLVVLAIATLFVSGCDRLTPEEQQLSDERDVALVEKANNAMPPLELVSPEPILLPDIERYDLLGEMCSYAPGTSLGARVIAREADAFMKIDGEMQRFAADPGSRELPMHTHSVYNSKTYSLRLTLSDDKAGADAGGRSSYEGAITLRDAHGRVVYEGAGLAQCSG